jgi:uncharacterized membrane protein YgdD (TMEM256/DUF423 family)
MLRWAIVLAGINGLVAVAAGAFGAHGLRSRLSAEALGIFDTAARYHMYHALAMAAAAALAANSGWRSAGAATMCFQAGIVLFSGSLYAMALSRMEWTWLGPITPMGGLLFLIGWLCLARIGPARAVSAPRSG